MLLEDERKQKPFNRIGTSLKDEFNTISDQLR